MTKGGGGASIAGFREKVMGSSRENLSSMQITHCSTMVQALVFRHYTSTHTHTHTVTTTVHT